MENNAQNQVDKEQNASSENAQETKAFTTEELAKIYQAPAATEGSDTNPESNADASVAQGYQAIQQETPGVTIPTEQRYNPLAIIGFVLSFFTTIAGGIISLIGFLQIKKTGEKGKGLALAGTIIGFGGALISFISMLLLVPLLTAIFAQASSYSSDYSYYDNLDSSYSSSDSAEGYQLTYDDPYCTALDGFFTEVSAQLENFNTDEDYAPLLEQLRSNLVDSNTNPDLAADITEWLAFSDKQTAEASEKFYEINSTVGDDYTNCVPSS